MPVRQLFATPLYDARIGDDALLDALEDSVRIFAQEDLAGRRWCAENGYRGYTSYASLNDLPRRDPAFGDLKRILDGHVRAFAKACHFAEGTRLKLDSLWVNVLQGSGAHSGHIHPHSAVSGTLYLRVPKGSGALRLEDPRLPLMMAAPGRSADAPEEVRAHVYVPPERGMVLLWESWLRHEVVGGTAKSDRISVSFNYS